VTIKTERYIEVAGKGTRRNAFVGVGRVDLVSHQIISIIPARLFGDFGDVEVVIVEHPAEKI